MNWKKIAVDRDILSVDRHYYDIYFNEEGFGGNFIWNTGHTWRHPFSLVKDYFIRKKYSSMNPTEAIKFNEKNFFFKYEDIQGVVDDDLHKMFEMLTSTELIRIMFRKIPEYESFSATIAEKVSEKYHKKEVDVKISVKQGY